MPPHAAAAICDTQQQQHQAELPLPVLDENDSSIALSKLEEGCLQQQQRKSSSSSSPKRVTFSVNDDDNTVTATVYDVLHRSDYSPEEKSNTWMNMLDVFRIRQDNMDSYFAQDGHIRGLESYIPQVVQERKATIEFARTVVVKHQEADCEMDYLAFLYGSASMKSKDSAYSRGLLDQRIAISLDYNDREEDNNEENDE